MTAHVEVHPHAAATSRTLRQDIGRPSSMSRPVARSNYGYLDDDDDDDDDNDDLEGNFPERHRDWPSAQQTRRDFTRPVPGDDLEDMMSPPSYQNADPYRRPPNTNKGLSVISSNLNSSALQSNYNRGGIGVYPADINVSLNDTDV